MNPKNLPTAVQPDHWEELRAHTNARIALGRVGASLPTGALLRFGLAHAQARDAVHRPLGIPMLREQLHSAGFHSLHVRSRAPDRHSYLLRPDLGRSLNDSDAQMLQTQAPIDLAIVIADGLSSFAIERQALPLLQIFRDTFATNWNALPLVIAEQGRVAIGDEVGAALRAKLAIVLIGERPGLSSPDSLGIYITFDPRPGRMDSERNCISNVRPEGLGFAAAAHKLVFLTRQALHLGLSGVKLKDGSAGTLAGDLP